MHVRVARTPQALGELGVILARQTQLLGMPVRQRARQRFPNVAEQDDALEVPLQKSEELHELSVIVTE